MNNFSKLQFSDEEQQLLTNPGWILTKLKIIDQIHRMLGELALQQKAVVHREKNWLPEAVVESAYKISKGENYLQLPYLILDYPKCFGTENIFAVRTMFWWGNFFSVTLQLSGSYKKMFQERIMANLAPIQHYGAYLCVNESQWQHHWEADNYASLKTLAPDKATQLIRDKAFIKLAIKYPLSDFANTPELLKNGFEEMIKWIKP